MFPYPCFCAKPLAASVSGLSGYSFRITSMWSEPMSFAPFCSQVSLPFLLGVRLQAVVRHCPLFPLRSINKPSQIGQQLVCHLCQKNNVFFE